MNEDINNNIVPTTESMPQQPIQPTPAMPQQPVGPAPAMPQQPVQPTPVMPQQPVQPTPVMPQQPAQPTPVMPQQPVQPAPTMPQQPVGPTPVMPQQPTQEANAVDPMSAVSNLNKEEAMEEALSHTTQYSPFQAEQQVVNEAPKKTDNRKAYIFIGIIVAVMALFILLLPYISKLF